ncbi:unnamed protein product, partial [Rotaria magnacalcarata]
MLLFHASTLELLSSSSSSWCLRFNFKHPSQVIQPHVALLVVCTNEVIAGAGA